MRAVPDQLDGGGVEFDQPPRQLVGAGDGRIDDTRCLGHLGQRGYVQCGRDLAALAHQAAASV